MKVVVTGGAGFIGSHIVEYWNERNADVHIIDNLRTGFEKNISQFKNVQFHKCSITEREQVFKIIDGADYVFNLAALVSVPESLEKPFECIDINVNGLINILDASKIFGVKKVVHTSSAAIYGDDPELPKRTSMKPLPKTPYGITKLDGEYYCQMYFEQYGLETVSLRYFNVFGPRQDPKSQYAAAVPIFIDKAANGQDITIFGDGEQTRDFIYVKDVVQANVIAAQKAGLTGVFNVANGTSITIKALAEKIIEQTKSKSKIIYKEERPGDIKHSLASVEETLKHFEKPPQFSMETGLDATIEYFINRK